MTARKLGDWSPRPTSLDKKYQLGRVAEVNDLETTAP